MSDARACLPPGPDCSGTSNGVPCSSISVQFTLSNCVSASPTQVGILALSIVIAAVVACLVAACFGRRVFMFHRYGGPSQRSGLGLLASIFSFQGMPRPPVDAR